MHDCVCRRFVLALRLQVLHDNRVRRCGYLVPRRLHFSLYPDSGFDDDDAESDAEDDKDDGRMSTTVPIPAAAIADPVYQSVADAIINVLLLNRYVQDMILCSGTTAVASSLILKKTQYPCV